MSSGPKKGSAWERTLCKSLSIWWAGRSDVFWRTHGSGSRATQRASKGLSTAGQHGDVCAVDPIGIPLMDLVTIELKNGYNKFTIMDLLDKHPRMKEQIYEKWIKKAIRDHKAAGSYSWMLVVKRDQREALILTPLNLSDLNCADINSPSTELIIKIDNEWILIYVITLNNFFQRCSYPKIYNRALVKKSLAKRKDNCKITSLDSILDNSTGK